MKRTPQYGTRKSYPSKTFRLNVAALIRYKDKFLACQTLRHPNWQSVQGGLDKTDESVEAALFRELGEELGAPAQAFKILKRSNYWRRYRFPPEFLVRGKHCGQEQLWFEVELLSLDAVCLDKSCREFRDTKLIDIDEFLKTYAAWKRAPFVDFCLELGLC